MLFRSILLNYLVRYIHFDRLRQPHFTTGFAGNDGPLPLPLITWRVDVVVLVVLGFILLPTSLGRWRLGKAEGVVLITLYVLYVMLELVGHMRM